MPSIEEMIQIQEAANDVEILGVTENGTKLVSYEDYVKLSQKDLVNGVERSATMNADGTVARPGVAYLAVNPDSLFCNRFRKRGKGIDVVRDYRAIKDLDNYNQIYTRQIFAFHLERDKSGKLTCPETLYVTDDDFMRDFRSTLDYNSMREVLAAIAGTETDNASPVAMPI